ncbi:hypothetical protein HPP92_003519 [Vanilla planifolia]|uniref:Cytochrome P450 n=1 Tax=Vanilla planifolia TaxID=51239 RepID=A0A835SGL9_VANPL|nr:hypothetical protein HPP92_003920 [Vanilla planifolia]KAG0503447.1 hypothetical protein HPP92_003519 [Vanilla planifolia]
MQGTMLQGYDIPGGPRVFINKWTIAREDKYWVERSHEFWPEKFLNCTTGFIGQHFHYVPFRAGRRGCPGLTFTSVVIQYFVANLLFHFDWEIPKTREIGCLI